MASNDFPAQLNFDKTGTFNGSGVTGLIDLVGCVALGIRTPASMVGTTLTFQSDDGSGSNSLPLRTNANTDVSVTIDGTARQYILDPAQFAGVRFLKVISSSTSDSGKTITLATRPV